MSVIQLIQKKYLRDERVLQLLLLLSLLRGSPNFFFDNDIDFFHGRNNLERDLSFGNVLGHTTHFSSSFGNVLHPKSLDCILANYQQSVLQDLNILGNYDHSHSAQHFQGALTSHFGIQAYLLNAESSVESSVEGGYIVGSPMPESLNESDPRTAVLTASLPRSSNDIFEDLDLLDTIWKQDLIFPFTQETYNENEENDDENTELASSLKLDFGHVFSFTKDKDHGEEPNRGSLIFEIPEDKELDLLMNFTSVANGDEFLCTNISLDEEGTSESEVQEEVEKSSSQSILEEDQLALFSLDEALKLVGLDSCPESESKDYKDIDTDSGCGDSAVSDLGTDFVPPDSLDELNDSLDEMIQASQMHHQHSRNFQSRLGGLVRSGSMEQRWQDLASLLSIPSPDQAHHAQSPPAVAMASHATSPIHTHSHSHQPTPVHHPHALYPPHEGVSLCSPSTSIPRSILVHNANTPPQPPPPPPPPPIPESHNITYANSIGASSHLVASSMNLANNSDISNNDHQHYKMETSSTLPQDIMYYQNSGTEMNQSTDGFLSSILNDEDLQLMDIPLNEYNGRNGSDYGVNTYRYSSSEDPHRIPVVAQKKHHMFGKRYFHENSHAGTTSSNNLGASGNTLGGGIPIVTPYASPYATAQGTTPMEGAAAIDPSEMKYSCTMDFRPDDATPAVDHVQHNHTYHMSPDGPSGIRPNSRDKKGRKNDSEKNMSRDEKRARAMNLPISCDDIINLPMDEFNERISKYDLSEAQLSLIRDIRRRGKNKVAAQNCRKRKLDQIVHLAEEVKVIQYRKNELHSQLDHLSSERSRIKHKFSLLYRHIFQSLRDQDGNPYSPHEYSLQQSSDGSIHLVLRTSPHSGDYASNKGRSSNDE